MTPPLITLLILLTATLAMASCPTGAPTIQPITRPEPVASAERPAPMRVTCVLITDEGVPYEYCEEMSVVEAWLTEQAKGLNCRARLVDAVRHLRPDLPSDRTVESMNAEIDRLLQECP